MSTTATVLRARAHRSSGATLAVATIRTLSGTVGTRTNGKQPELGSSAERFRKLRSSA
jgi:hypothetical protein